MQKEKPTQTNVNENYERFSKTSARLCESISLKTQRQVKMWKCCIEIVFLFKLSEYLITRANFSNASPVSSLRRLKLPSTLLHEPAHC